MSTPEQEVTQDDIPFEVTEEVNPDEVGDLTAVKRDDTLPAARDVTFIVHAAKVDVRKDEAEKGGNGDVLSKALRCQMRVAPGGIDGAGAFAGRVIFCDMPLVLNLPAMKARHERIQEGLVSEGKVKAAKPFNEKWHKDQLVDFKEFALATGLAEMKEVNGQARWTMTGPINDELLAILASGDVEFIANLARKENVGMDRFENKLSMFRAPKQQE